MLNINDNVASMWRDSATAASMAKPSANTWGTTEMASISRRGQFTNNPGANNSNEANINGSANATSDAAAAGGRLRIMFSAENMADLVHFGGPPQKSMGLEDAMERLNMVKCFAHFARSFL